ncbi:hypothetical protein Tco_1093598 [Tanacetum coccineum]|uniref:DNA-directed RNA polymerase n=1 Tax=Tanacetum coccineum TaxID=301880 RepID=A0ABQ5IDP0_9ASTR
MRTASTAAKPCQEDSYELLYGGGGIPFQLKLDSLLHAHAQTTKIYYKHQDSRIMKAQELKTKTSANSDIQDIPLRYQVYRGRLLESFQEDSVISPEQTTFIKTRQILDEALHVVVEDAINVGLYRGVQVRSLHISYLLFADDNLFLGEWSRSNIIEIVSLL